MKKTLTGLAVLAASLGFTAVPASAAVGTASADPVLRVKLVSPDGRPKLKVQRRLKVLSSCSTDCRMRITMILKTPLGSTKRGGSRDLPAGGVWSTWIQLNNFGLGYLKRNYKRSSMRVIASARDLKTGQRITRIRKFGFYR